jgi:membrane-associated phospholipid phosphatase
MASYLMAYNGFSNASKWICYTLAVLVGLSRIYLGQHFYIDVIFGALFGIIAFDLALLIMGSAKKDYWNRSILKSRTK